MPSSPAESPDKLSVTPNLTRRVSRVGLLFAGVVAAVLCFSVHGHSHLTPDGRETEVTVGALGPWLEYVSAPQRTAFQVNLVTGSVLCGVVAVVCFWGYRRLARPGAGQ